MFGLRRHFLLDPHVIFLNHGSFGAAPRTVFRAYQRWGRELERQPVEFLGRRATDLMAGVRASSGAYLGTAAGIRAGIPSVLIPILGNQLFWGQRVADLGVGAHPIPRKNLTAERLATAIHQVVNDTLMRQRAAALGKKIRAEDGVGQAVTVIRQYLGV